MILFIFSILLKLGFKSWDNVGRGELSKSSLDF